MQGMLAQWVRAEWAGRWRCGEKESGCCLQVSWGSEKMRPQRSEMVFFLFRCGVTEIKGDPREEREGNQRESRGKGREVGTFRFQNALSSWYCLLTSRGPGVPGGDEGLHLGILTKSRLDEA